MVKDNNKVILEGKLVLHELSESLKKEVASRIPIPNDNRQDDLLLMSAILVSTGTNKNGATFLGSELVTAKDTIADKALDVEHKQDVIIGHIKSALYLDQDGKILDVDKMYSSLETASQEDRNLVVAAMDGMDMDIGIVCVVHKHRFKDLAEEIKKGEWHVSMECYYQDFDLKVGDIIIPKEQASKMSFDGSTRGLVNLVVSGQSLGNHKVSRVLRGIKFCGVGIVKHPANVRSVIDEAAGQVMVNDEVSEIMTSLYREAAGIQGTLKINSTENIKHLSLPEDLRKEIILRDSEAEPSFMVMASEKISEHGPLVKSTGNGLDGKPAVTYCGQSKASQYKTKEEATKIAVKATRITGVNHLVIESLGETSVNDSKVFSEEDLEKGFALLTTDNSGSIIKQVETANFAFVGQGRGGGKWGASDSGAGICVDFAKYHYEFDRAPNPGKLVATHWCKLFNQSCPVFGADPLARECLRHKYSRLIKDDSIHFQAVREEKWNPRSTHSPGHEEVEFLPADKQPSPPDDSGDSSANEKYGERFIPGPAEFDDSFAKPSLEEVTFDDGHPNNKAVDAPAGEDLIVTERVTDFKPGIEELTSLLGETASKVNKAKSKIFTKSELSSLDDRDFAFTDKRELPLHTPEAVEEAMQVICKKISKERSQKETGNPLKYLHPHARVLRKAYIFGLDTRNFEHVLPYEEGGEDPNYGIPRLKLLPLDSRPSIIAAISRFDKIRQDITEEERNMLFVKIVKAASRFEIDVEKFVSRVRNRD